MGRFGNLQQALVGDGIFAIANKRHSLLHAVGEAVGFIVGEADGLVIFQSSLLLIAHQSVSVTQAELRGYEVRINLEGRAIVCQGAFKIPRHAQQFSVRILRIGFFREQGHVTIHDGKRIDKLPVAGLHIRKIVERGRKVFVDGEGLFKKALRLIVAVFAHQPVAREIEQVLVVRIHLQHVVHGGNTAEEVAFLNLSNPGNHQLLARRKLARKGFGFGARHAHFLGIAAVEGNPCPGHRKIGIFFDGRAPFLVAAVQIKVFVVGHSLLVELPRFSG